MLEGSRASNAQSCAQSCELANLDKWIMIRPSDLMEAY
jgi:hypothetical protein